MYAPYVKMFPVTGSLYLIPTKLETAKDQVRRVGTWGSLRLSEQCVTGGAARVQ